MLAAGRCLPAIYSVLAPHSVGKLVVAEHYLAHGGEPEGLEFVQAGSTGEGRSVVSLAGLGLDATGAVEGGGPLQQALPISVEPASTFGVSAFQTAERCRGPALFARRAGDVRGSHH